MAGGWPPDYILLHFFPPITMSKPSSVEQALFLSLGAAATARERLTDFIDYLIKEGKAATTDRDKLMKQLHAKGETEYNKMKKTYESAIHASLKAMDIPTRKEFDALRKEVKAHARHHHTTKKR